MNLWIFNSHNKYKAIHETIIHSLILHLVTSWCLSVSIRLSAPPSIRLPILVADIASTSRDFKIGKEKEDSGNPMLFLHIAHFTCSRLYFDESSLASNLTSPSLASCLTNYLRVRVECFNLVLHQRSLSDNVERTDNGDPFWSHTCNYHLMPAISSPSANSSLLLHRSFVRVDILDGEMTSKFSKFMQGILNSILVGAYFKKRFTQ